MALLCASATSRRARIAWGLTAVLVAALLSSFVLLREQRRWSSIPGGGTKIENSANTSRRHHPMSGFYSSMRPDRAGAVLQDMLVAQAYAWSRNLTYLGACPTVPPPTSSSSTTSPRLTAEQVTELITNLGLDDVLRIECPPSSRPTSGHDVRDEVGSDPVVDRKFYSRHNVRVCTTEWQRYIHAQVQRRRPAFRSPDLPSPSPRRAVVHIRRGDVTPCDPQTSERYLPNSYYLDVLKRYVPKHYRVTIYSERNSVEPWDDFANFTLLLGDGDHTPSSSMQDVARIWLDMTSADILILSKSSFSVVPALLRGDTSSSNEPPISHVIYSDFWVDPLPHWTRVPQSVQRLAATDTERVKDEHCPK